MCIDPSTPAAAGIADKALRALSGRHGKDEKDLLARQKAGQRFIAELTPLEQVPEHSLLRGFKEPLSQRQPETGGVRIPRKALHERLIKESEELLDRMEAALRKEKRD
jgi:hypothetical protein